VADVLVALPPALVRLFPGCPAELVLSAATIAEVIDALDTRWPGMRDRLCDSTPRVRRHLNIFVDGERATLATPVTGTSEVFIMTAISGG
jgi:molybdopterin synthase sulfur carrier subunit